MAEENASFYAFKPSGKWKYEGRGYLSNEAFRDFDDRKGRILRENGNCWPGMIYDARDLICVVIPDESHETGFPLMFIPK